MLVGATTASFAPTIGEKARTRSSKAVKYAAGEIGRARVIEDFLPSPDELVARDDTVKVTLQLSRRSVDLSSAQQKRGECRISG